MGKRVRIVVIGDDTGELRITLGRGLSGDDIEPGQLIQVTGNARRSGNQPIFMTDPSYRIVQTTDGGAVPGGNAVT